MCRQESRPLSLIDSQPVCHPVPQRALFSLRVAQLIQQCLDFPFVLFVSKCLGVYLLLPGHSVRRPGSLPSYHLVARTVFLAFTSPGVFSTILDEN